MVGKGVLLECLENDEVEAVLVIGRQPVDVTHEKLKELIHKDLFDLSKVKDELKGYNVCYFCVGVTSFRMSEKDYSYITHDLSKAFAESLFAISPNMTFCFVSGAGSDSTEKSKTMWKRVKGKAENAVLAVGFQSAFAFRPAYIHPTDGIGSRTPLYDVPLKLLRHLYPVLKKLFPNSVTTTRKIGQAMINIVSEGYEKPVLESNDINSLAPDR